MKRNDEKIGTNVEKKESLREGDVLMVKLVVSLEDPLPHEDPTTYWNEYFIRLDKIEELEGNKIKLSIVQLSVPLQFGFFEADKEVLTGSYIKEKQKDAEGRNVLAEYRFTKVPTMQEAQQDQAKHGVLLDGVTGAVQKDSLKKFIEFHGIEEVLEILGPFENVLTGSLGSKVVFEELIEEGILKDSFNCLDDFFKDAKPGETPLSKTPCEVFEGSKEDPYKGLDKSKIVFN